MTASAPTPAKLAPIIGYEAIAKAASKATNTSISVRTAKRYASQEWAMQTGRMRLPVMRWGNGTVDILPEELEAWARAFCVRRPVGARLPGNPAKRTRAA